ncbi:MAG: hypothetical protein ACTHM7_11375 [Ginsengibacter sp.]
MKIDDGDIAEKQKYRVDNQYRINDWFVKTRTTAWESRYRS